MSNVVDGNFRTLTVGLRGGTEPPDNGGMDARITKLENIAEKTGERLDRIDGRLDRIDGRLDRIDGRLGSIDQDLAVIKTQMDGFTKHYATRADVLDAKNSIIMWLVSAILLAQLLPALLKKFGL